MDEARAARINERLRRLAELHDPDAPRVDYSRDAVSGRLRELSELSALCARLEALGAR